jgi:predicted MFS family arabinose efflux permease
MSFTQDVADSGPSGPLIWLFAASTGALVANIYYAQPLVAAIGADFGVSTALAGSVVSVTQLGYGAGLFFLVPLADLVENRRLLLAAVAALTLGLIGVASAGGVPSLFLALFAIGLFATGAQVIVPLAAHLAPAARRGRVVGNVMGGLITGIMLARPAALFIAAHASWRAVFWFSAVLMAALGAALYRAMPSHEARADVSYPRMLASLPGLLRASPQLRWRAAFQALMFAAFNMFWTTAPLMLSERFHLGQSAIGLFALAGAGGALAAPIAGRLADRGFTDAATACAMIVLGLSFTLTEFAAESGTIVGLAALAIILDAAVQTNQVVGQRIVYSGPAESRGRVNAVYMTLMFLGGATGSVLGTWIYSRGGWSAVAMAGGAIGVVNLVLFGLQRRLAPFARGRVT